MGVGTTGPTVPYEEACRRLLAKLPPSHSRAPWPASACADVIWPGHRMRAQGAAFAAGKILHRMQADGLIRWVWITDTGRHGYVRAIEESSVRAGTDRTTSGAIGQP